MAIVAVEISGKERAGSAFHLGDGYYATSCHVVQEEGLTIRGVGPEGLDELFTVEQLFTDEANDVAIVRIAYVPDTTIPVGSHLNDWIVDKDFVLSEVLILGYPPIPQADRHVLVAVSGEVNAVIDRRDRTGATPDFVVSPLPRGGFSGGPVISAHDFVMGVISHELTDDPGKPGFTAAVSVEPLISLMMTNELRPSGQVPLLEELGKPYEP